MGGGRTAGGKGEWEDEVRVGGGRESRRTGMKIAVGHRPKSDQILSVAALFLPVTVT